MISLSSDLTHYVNLACGLIEAIRLRPLIGQATTDLAREAASAKFEEAFRQSWSELLSARQRLEELAVGDSMHAAILDLTTEPITWIFRDSMQGGPFDLDNYDFLQDKGMLAACLCPVDFNGEGRFRRNAATIQKQIDANALVTLRQARKLFTKIGEERSYPGLRTLQDWAQNDPEFPPSVDSAAVRNRRFRLAQLGAYLACKKCFERCVKRS